MNSKYYQDIHTGLVTPHRTLATTRRDMLKSCGAGFGMLPLAWLASNSEAMASSFDSKSPLAAKQTHFPATAKRVIYLFMEGGPSHIDTFDPKPALNELNGKPLPDSFGKVILAMGESNAPLLASQRKWKQHGEGGTWVSDWLPNIASCADDIAVIRSCWGNGINHAGGVCQMNTGLTLAGRPSLGSWVSYGLGTENQDLPAFVVMKDSGSEVVNGPRSWGTGFMPAVYQGTVLQSEGDPIPNLYPPKSLSDERQRRKMQFFQQMNRQHAELRPDETELDARIRSYELAFRMQSEAPLAVDLSEETKETHEMYGTNNATTKRYGEMCLLARRLAERGVRFIQLYHGSGSKWDAHSGIEKNHSSLCAKMDQPVAALLRDLKQRGMLEDTLVLWGGEFGRTPMSEQGNGRDHNPSGFTMWAAGGGVKGGQTIGATDEVGLHAIEDKMHIHDLHATWLSLLGLDHMQLEFRHKGRPERPTINEGHPLKKLTTG
ncbi:DUF1501 domain-containing protein [uncultured Rubinisphaera sp.]|uniref:DUF1501 domain-containing protein n=1 Tax=uncultured Rubinisphaera sp. TaxID=1678686 RepID=UPI0030DB27B8